jgi:hypothetical protein
MPTSPILSAQPRNASTTNPSTPKPSRPSAHLGISSQNPCRHFKHDADSIPCAAPRAHRCSASSLSDPAGFPCNRKALDRFHGPRLACHQGVALHCPLLVPAEKPSREISVASDGASPSFSFSSVAQLAKVILPYRKMRVLNMYTVCNSTPR